MSKIKIELDPEDWVWLCEFLATVIHEGELDPYTAEDTAKIYNLLRDAERGVQ